MMETTQVIVRMLRILLLCLLCFRECNGWLFNLWRPICYTSPNIGCFPTTEPFTNAGGIAPQNPRLIPTYFYFHREGQPTQTFSVHNATQDCLSKVQLKTRNRKDSVFLHVGQGLVLRGRFQPSSNTVFIIHGYMEHARRSWVHNMVQELYKKGDLNVIAVNWRAGANRVNYYQSVANTRVVGAVVALVIESLQTLGGNLSTFHLVGFSLGAHIAGYAGRRVQGLGRITGLDPAGPAFEGTSPEVRLDSTDAEIVDVIHTDGDSRNYGLGTMQAMGDVDFYPNGGFCQPGCPTGVFAKVTAAFWSSTFGDAFACSHARALDIFTISINSTCPETSLRQRTLQYRWSSAISSDWSNRFNEGWQSCSSSHNCPRMGYDLDPDTVTNFRRQYGTESIDDQDLLISMATSISEPFCCK